MMNSEEIKLNFSQRNGYDPIPKQLEIGQVSDEFRNLVYYAFYNMITRIKRRGVDFDYIDKTKGLCT